MNAPANRVRSIDMLRGLVMVIMALDHCRDFFSPTPFIPDDLSATTTAWFITRWVTHLCAPAFVFLAGTSAWLYRDSRESTNNHLARFLVSRGIWLIVVEILVIDALLHFGSFPFPFFFLQVIWVIGWSMLLMAFMIFLPTWAIAVAGGLMICSHNLLDAYPTNPWGGSEFVWQLLHVQGFSLTQPIPTLVAYPLIPWPGVMMLGYCFGQLLTRYPERRNRICLTWGAAAVLLFIGLRAINGYGDPQKWEVFADQPLFTAFSFVNTTKYPPSLLFLLMTLGPALLLLPLLERCADGRWRWLQIFGRVPFFYYVLHWFLIRSASWVWIKVQFDSTQNLIFTPIAEWPPDYAPSLFRTYASCLIVVVVTYPLCRWYAQLRARRRDLWWLSYL